MITRTEQVATREICNHETAGLSELDLRMVKCVPPGGNWRNIDPSIPSKRLEQIREGRKGGSRSTYYGRLRLDRPAYTISTNFNRPGNGCFIHPLQDRLISLREGARLQSFPDGYRFLGSRASIYKQIGNAVPPLLAYALGRQIQPGTFIDLFCGAGGLSVGLEMAGHRAILAADNNEQFLETYSRNRVSADVLSADLTEEFAHNEIVSRFRGSTQPDMVVGGPPCQGFSEAGNKRRSDDPRNLLYEEFLSVVTKLQPKYFIMEQIPSVRSLEGGAFFQDLLSKFQMLTGYRTDWRILKAEEYGVPQLRRRLFLVGTRTPSSFSFPFPMFGPLLTPPFTVGDAISDLPPLEAGAGKEVMTYTPPASTSMYQQWAMGLLHLESIIH